MFLTPAIPIPSPVIMPTALAALTPAVTANFPLLSPLITRCCLAVLAAVIPLFRRPINRSTAADFLRFCPPKKCAGTASGGRRAWAGGALAARDGEIFFSRSPPAHYDVWMPFAVDPPPLPARAQALLDFWFGPPDHPERLHHKQIWFRSTPKFDAAVRENFAADHDTAAASKLHDWENEPLSALAHVMLLDQVPRNVFRSTPRAFATDHLALASTMRAMERGFDQAVPAAWRAFFYLPFEHSEVLDHQRRGLDLLLALPPVPGRR